MITAKSAWISLYSNEVESIWTSERPELRTSAMVLHVLKMQFHKLQIDLDNQMKDFERRLQTFDEVKANEKQVTENNLSKESELSKSPTFNRTRNISFKRRNQQSNRSSLFKENKMELPPMIVLPRKEELDVDIIESSPEVSIENHSRKFFTPNTATRNSEVSDSSGIIENTPVKSLKKTNNGKIKKKVLKNTAIQKLFQTKQPATKLVGSNDTTFFSPELKKPDKAKDAIADETFCDVKVKTSDISKKVAKADFEDYDKFPIANIKSPQYAHKMEPVRRKAERMQLPGWSCEDCRKFYESSDLSPEELREKMNACSRHRNKFQPFDTTINGYWDVEMFHTQDQDENM